MKEVPDLLPGPRKAQCYDASYQIALIANLIALERACSRVAKAKGVSRRNRKPDLEKAGLGLPDCFQSFSVTIRHQWCRKFSWRTLSRIIYKLSGKYAMMGLAAIGGELGLTTAGYFAAHVFAAAVAVFVATMAVGAVPGAAMPAPF